MRYEHTYTVPCGYTLTRSMSYIPWCAESRGGAKKAAALRNWRFK